MSADTPNTVDPETATTTDRDQYRGRVTIDIDGYARNFEMKAIRAYYNLRRVAVETDVAISSSGEGVHLTGWFTDPKNFPERLQLRRALCDDPNRIEIDMERRLNGVYTGVLWDEKHPHRGPEDAPEDRPGKDRDFADIHDALSHMEMTNTDATEQVQRLADHGHKAAPSLARNAEGLQR